MLERVFVRVHFVVRTEVQRHLDVNHRVAGEHASLEGVFNALLNGRDVFARNHAALDGVDELEAAARGQGFELENHVTVLAAAAGLLGELALGVFDNRADRFAVGNLGLADLGFNTEFATHAVDDDFEVKLAHTGDDGLAGFFVGAHAEGRIFAEPDESSASAIFSWSALVLGSTACEITGSGNSMRSRMIGAETSQSVSPVVTSLRPTAAAMSPASASVISLRSLACICSRRPMRSFLFFTELSTVSPDFRMPE